MDTQKIIIEKSERTINFKKIIKMTDILIYLKKRTQLYFYLRNKNNLIKATKMVGFMFILIFHLANSPILSAQNCNNLINKNAKPTNTSFIKSPLTRIVQIKMKERYTLTINMFEGREYFISVIGKPQLGNIQLKLISADDNKLIFDNAADEFVDHISIKAKLAQKIIIELSAPSGKFSGNERECVSIFIASRKF